MSKKHDIKRTDESAYDLLVAEEELILRAQMLVQRALREKGLSQKQLAERLGVGESYISQMLGLSARNLTLRTIARVMAALGEKATLVLDEPVKAHSDAVEEVQGTATTIASRDGLIAAAEEALAAASDDAKAFASRIASVGLSAVWTNPAVNDDCRVSEKRRSGEAAAYASYDPDVQEMALAA